MKTETRNERNIGGSKHRRQKKKIQHIYNGRQYGEKIKWLSSYEKN